MTVSGAKKRRATTMMRRARTTFFSGLVLRRGVSPLFAPSLAVDRGHLFLCALRAYTLRQDESRRRRERFTRSQRVARSLIIMQVQSVPSTRLRVSEPRQNSFFGLAYHPRGRPKLATCARPNASGAAAATARAATVGGHYTRAYRTAATGIGALGGVRGFSPASGPTGRGEAGVHALLAVSNTRARQGDASLAKAEVNRPAKRRRRAQKVANTRRCRPVDTRPRASFRPAVRFALPALLVACSRAGPARFISAFCKAYKCQ